jgi:hypothetical protein
MGIFSEQIQPTPNPTAGFAGGFSQAMQGFMAQMQEQKIRQRAFAQAIQLAQAKAMSEKMAELYARQQDPEYQMRMRLLGSMPMFGGGQPQPGAVRAQEPQPIGFVNPQGQASEPAMSMVSGGVGDVSGRQLTPLPPAQNFNQLNPVAQVAPQTLPNDITKGFVMNPGWLIGGKGEPFVKDQMFGLKEEQRQDRLEKIAADRLQKLVSMRSGGLGLQDSKVNQAIDLRTMINQNYDPKTGTYNIPPALHAELALGLARLLSPNGQVGIQLEEILRQKTAKEGLANTLIWMGFDPKQVGGTTQSVINMFIHTIDRQGLISEQLRDKYLDDARKMFPKELDKERADSLKEMQLGSSFKELAKTSPGYKEKAASELSLPSEVKTTSQAVQYLTQQGLTKDQAVEWIRSQ